MKTKVLAILAALALSPVSLMAQTSLQAGGVYKVRESRQCNNQGCIEQEKLYLQYVHAIAITPEQAAGIVEGTEFELQSEWGALIANVSDDPSFVNGKRSVSISNIQIVAGAPARVYMKLEWNNTQLRLSASAFYNYTDVDQISKTAEEKGNKIATVFSLVTKITPPVVPQFTTEAHLKVLSTDGEFESVNEQGRTSETEFHTFTSFGFEQDS